MARATRADTVTIRKGELKAMLRQVVREELRRLFTSVEQWQFDPDSPLYRALFEIHENAKTQRPSLLNDQEVWGK